jgi:DNA-binding response OmpR family regulator
MARILLIDDDEMLRDCVAKTLNSSSKDMQVISVGNGRVGLQLAQELQPDLIVCDLNMPEVSGYDVLARIRRDEMTANIPFIFLTGESSFDKCDRGLELGANQYLTKPFAVSEFLKAVKLELAT